LTGFTFAALIACEATVIQAISKAINPPITKYQADNSMWNAKRGKNHEFKNQ
jgi:cephalosporin-C deacetylase-like acetyl esterase